MGCKTNDGCDYDIVKAKVPKRDKAGNDISSEKMGVGGRRRADGTLVVLAYDLELIEESEDFSPDDTEERLRQYAWEEQQRKSAQAENVQATVDFIFAFIEAATEYLENHPEVMVKIVDGVASFGRNVAGRFQSFKTKLIPKKTSRNKKSTKIKVLEPVTTKIELILGQNERTGQEQRRT